MAARPDDPLTLSRQLCFALYSATHAFNRVYRPLLDPLGLTYTQYLVMLALWEEDGQSVGGIGEQLKLDSNTLTPLIKRLEKAGHVRRERDGADERIVRVSLSESGHALRQAACQIPAAIAAAAALSPAEMSALQHQLLALRDAMDAHVPPTEFPGHVGALTHRPPPASSRP
jgi:DNA-binding MarR family transcriptional regulator